mmetsp:Transcript_10756/g.27192  ORF Transcript_10756/g.27192 Transcript_10756/m.27192 type:complete len:420 (-) Transcript_10756:2373-3632(-)
MSPTEQPSNPMVMWNYPLFNFFVKAVFDENATLVDLLKVVAFLAMLIFVSFYLLRPVLTGLVKGPLNKTMWKIVDMEYNRPDMIKFQEMFEITNKQEFFDKFILYGWPSDVLVYTQHLIGGLCAVPAVLGVGSFSASERSSLACLGILIEMGYEVQDFCTVLFYLFFMGEEGKKKYPMIAVIILVFHHGLTCTMGLPAILAYRDTPELHRLIFDLQFAGGLTGLFGLATRALDVTKKSDLRMFVFVNTFMLLLTVWMRFFDWFYLVYKLMAIFIADKNWTFLITGSIIFTAFSAFNLLFCVIPMCKRFVKFVKKLKAYESLPSDVDKNTRMASKGEFELAAGELAFVETRFEEALLSIFVDQEVERRHTFNSATLARSAAMAAALSGVSSRRLHPHRQSMVAWRGMPSRVKESADKKTE